MQGICGQSRPFQGCTENAKAAIWYALRRRLAKLRSGSLPYRSFCRCCVHHFIDFFLACLHQFSTLIQQNECTFLNEMNSNTKNVIFSEIIAAFFNFFLPSLLLKNVLFLSAASSVTSFPIIFASAIIHRRSPVCSIHSATLIEKQIFEVSPL